jgi:hypothetical protein
MLMPKICPDDRQRATVASKHIVRWRAAVERPSDVPDLVSSRRLARPSQGRAAPLESLPINPVVV